MAEAWRHIRLAVIYFTKGGSVYPFMSHVERASVSQAASQHVWDAAVILQRHAPASMCTYNLHMVVLYSGMQEKETGAIWNTMEFWIERHIQHLKSNTVVKTMHVPEVVLGNEFLLKCRLHESRDQVVHLHELMEQASLTESNNPKTSGKADDHTLPIHLECRVPDGAWMLILLAARTCYW